MKIGSFTVEGLTQGDYSVIRKNGNSYRVNGATITMLQHRFPELPRLVTDGLGDITPPDQLDFAVQGRFVEQADGTYSARAIPQLDPSMESHDLVLTRDEAILVSRS